MTIILLNISKKFLMKTNKKIEKNNKLYYIFKNNS